MIELGQKVRFVREPEFIGTISMVYRDSVVNMLLVTLYQVEWYGNPDRQPIRYGDEGDFTRRGYLAHELEVI